MHYDGRTSKHATELHDLQEHHQEHKPYTPAPLAYPWSRYAVKHLHRCCAGKDGMSTELQLHGDLNEATDDYHPECNETRLCSQRGRGNELSGADNGCRKDKSRAEESQTLGSRDGRFADGRCRYRIVVHATRMSSYAKMSVRM